MLERHLRSVDRDFRTQPVSDASALDERDVLPPTPCGHDTSHGHPCLHLARFLRPLDPWYVRPCLLRPASATSALLSAGSTWTPRSACSDLSMRLERMWRRSRSSPVQVLATWPPRPFLGRIPTRPSPFLSFRPLVFLGPSEGDPPDATVALPSTSVQKGDVAGPRLPGRQHASPSSHDRTFPLPSSHDFPSIGPISSVCRRGGSESLGSEGPFGDERRFVNAPRTVRDGHNEAPSTSERPPEVRQDRDEREAVGCTRSWTRAGVPSQARAWLGRRNGSTQGRVSKPGSGVQRCK